MDRETSMNTIKCPHCGAEYLTGFQRKFCGYCEALLDTGDNVNSPSHYKQGKFETIDVIESTLGKERFEGYLLGNVIKYLSRYRFKNGGEDIDKARWYLDRLAESVKEEYP